MIIESRESPLVLGAIRRLLRKYQGTLGVDLSFQRFEEELATFPGAYAPPRGTLLLATDDGAAIGCVGVRPLSADRCEMKRLYVRPVGRGRGLGRQLAEHAVAFARAAGYREMLLDTLPQMAEAGRLYAALGLRNARRITRIRCRARDTCVSR